MIMKNIKKIIIPEGAVKIIRHNGQIIWQGLKRVLKTISGITQISLLGCADSESLQSLIIKGDSTQSGVPTPDSPQEIIGVGEKTENLFDINSITFAKTGSGVIEGHIDGDTVVSDAATCDFAMLDYVFPAGVYTVYKSGVSLTLYKCKKDSFGIDGSLIVQVAASATKAKFTLTEPRRLILRIFTAGNTVSNIMILPGDFSKLPDRVYEPFNKYKINLNIQSRNLFNYDKIWFTYNSLGNMNVYYSTAQNGGISFGGVYAADGGQQVTIPVEEGKQYTLSYRNSGTKDVRSTTVYIIKDIGSDNKYVTADRIWAISDSSHLNNISIGEYGYGTTRPIPVGYKYLVFEAIAASGARTCFVDHIQIEEGTARTDYAPTNTHTIILDQPLLKIGDYVDYIDCKNKKVIRNVDKKTIVPGFIYRKCNQVCRMTMLGLTGGIANTPILSPLFKSTSAQWGSEEEIIFKHISLANYCYTSLKWDRLGLVYDGTNVYKKGKPDILLTDAQIVSIYKSYLNSFSEDLKYAYCPLSEPSEELLDIPDIAVDKGDYTISIEVNGKEYDFTTESDDNEITTEISDNIITEDSYRTLNTATIEAEYYTME